MESDPDQRYARARESLEGLGLGDAFGEHLFDHSPHVARVLRERQVSGDLWEYTDDTEMALSIMHVLGRCGEIDQDLLAESFAKRFQPKRAYGGAMCELLPRIRFGKSWRVEATKLFNGAGSWGNGSEMRVAPLGAYFADDLDAVVKQAVLSSEVTHAHPEGVAGAVAVAVAAAWAVRLRGADPLPRGGDLIRLFLPFIPDSFVRRKAEEAANMPENTSVVRAVRLLGSGSAISAQDTVPFVLWCASRHLDDYEEALWLTAGGFGDVDTNCAMVGGIVAAHVGAEKLPADWLRRREPFPDWL